MVVGTVRVSGGCRWDKSRIRSDVSGMVTAGRFDLGIFDIRRAGIVTILSR